MNYYNYKEKVYLISSPGILWPVIAVPLPIPGCAVVRVAYQNHRVRICDRTHYNCSPRTHQPLYLVFNTTELPPIEGFILGSIDAHLAHT